MINKINDIDTKLIINKIIQREESNEKEVNN